MIRSKKSAALRWTSESTNRKSYFTTEAIANWSSKNKKIKNSREVTVIDKAKFTCWKLPEANFLSDTSLWNNSFIKNYDM